MKALVRPVAAIALAAAVGTLMSPGTAYAAFLFGDTINAAVRRTTDPVGTNYFAPSTAVVNNDPEFITIDGDYEITANFQASDFVNLTVDRIPLSPGATPPNYRFSFTDLDFSPTSVIVGAARFAGTPSIGISDVTFGPSSAEFTVGTAFLSNGGSFGIGVRFNTVEIPEPAAAGLMVLAGAGLLQLRRVRLATSFERGKF